MNIDFINNYIIDNKLYFIYKSIIKEQDVFKYYDLVNKFNSQYDIDFNDLKKYDSRVKQKYKRLKKKIQYIKDNSDSLYFITFTFNDDNINMKNTRRFIKHYLDNLNCLYICNVDYGSINFRKHYHAIINKRIDLVLNPYNAGNINFKKVRNFNKYNLAKYINKLTYHGIKENTLFKKENLLTNI